nr:hypothetical protein [uncultured Cetobacterium sp.]
MKKILFLLFGISFVTFSAPKTSYQTGVAYALRNYFGTYNKEVLSVSDVVKIDDKIYAQKIKYKTYSDFGGRMVKEAVFIIKDINSVYTFVEKIDDENMFSLEYK